MNVCYCISISCAALEIKKILCKLKIPLQNKLFSVQDFILLLNLDISQDFQNWNICVPHNKCANKISVCICSRMGCIKTLTRNIKVSILCLFRLRRVFPSQYYWIKLKVIWFYIRNLQYSILRQPQREYNLLYIYRKFVRKIYL